MYISGYPVKQFSPVFTQLCEKSFFTCLTGYSKVTEFPYLLAEHLHYKCDHLIKETIDMHFHAIYRGVSARRS